MAVDEADVITSPLPAGDAAGSRSRVDARSALQGGLFALPVIGFLTAAWAHRWVTEDGFIYLRVVQQIGAGNGPVFNVGERVEAATGTLWVALLSLADLVTPIRLEWIAVLLGLGLGAAGITLAMLGARRLWSAHAADALFIPFGAVVFVVLLPVWVLASAGLETGLAFGWLGACLWILSGWTRSPDERLPTLGAVVLGLGWLIRPELVVFSAGFLLATMVLNRRGGRDRLRVAVAFLAIPVAYQIFRMGYYGSLVPNTAIAKEGNSTNWTRGWAYLRDFIGPYWLWIPLLALFAGGYIPLVAAARRQTRVVWVVAVFIGASVVQTLYFVAVGGDYMHARLLLPGFFALCVPVAAIPAARRQLAALIVVPWAVLAVLVLRPDQYDSNPLAHGFVMVLPTDFGKVTRDDWGWGADGSALRWYQGPAYYYEAGLLRYPRADFPVRKGVQLPYGAFFGVGISSYATGNDFHVLDLMGLADSFTAHLETTPSASGIKRFPGHEKPLPSPWIAARLTQPGSRPDSKPFPSFAVPLIPVTTGREYQEQVAWARAALRCGAIKRILEAADAPMTPKRFATNFFGSFTNTRTRIPPDPRAAYRTFCGTGIPREVRELRGAGDGL